MQGRGSEGYVDPGDAVAPGRTEEAREAASGPLIRSTVRQDGSRAYQGPPHAWVHGDLCARLASLRLDCMLLFKDPIGIRRGFTDRLLTMIERERGGSRWTRSSRPPAVSPMSRRSPSSRVASKLAFVVDPPPLPDRPRNEALPPPRRRLNRRMERSSHGTGLSAGARGARKRWLPGRYGPFQVNSVNPQLRSPFAPRPDRHQPGALRRGYLA